MALQFPQPNNVPTFTDILQTVNKIRQQRLANKNIAMKNQMAQETMPETIAAQNAKNSALAQTAMTEAQAKALSDKINAENPLLSKTGNAGQVGAYKYLNKTGNNNPSTITPNQDLAKLLMSSILSSQNAQNSRSNYYDGLNKTLSLRYAPSITKNQIQEKLQSLGFPASFSSTVAANPDEANKIIANGTNFNDWYQQNHGGQPSAEQSVSNQAQQDAQQTEGAIKKQTSDAAVRDRATYANAITKTLDTIPVDSLEHYAGGSGRVNLMEDRLGNFLGQKTSPQYNDYQSFMNTTMPFLKGQITKFYGGSVQPAAQRELDILGNPTNWKSNPGIVRSSLKKLQDLFNSEAGTFSTAASKGTQNFVPAKIPGLSETKNQGIPAQSAIEAEIARRKKAGTWK
jgi:hypothetical protein